MRALAVFHDFGGHPLDKFLKSGFRHCFCAIETEWGWIRVDGMGGVPVVEGVASPGYDLAAFYRGEDFTVIEMERGTSPPALPMVWANCTGLVKAFLGIRCHAASPYGLYKHLKGSQS